MTLRNRFTRGMFRFRRGPRKPLHWTGTTSTVLVAANTLTEQPLLVTGDYSDSTQMSPRGVTMVRCVGNICMAPDATSGLYHAQFGIAHVDEDDTPLSGGLLDPSQATQLVAERWLWLKTIVIRVHGTGAGSGEGNFHNFEFDIRQRCRLDDSGISLIVKNPTASAGSWQISYMARTLVSGDTN